ncbi:hypothetical protein MHYP_G00058460 [Metynnis hypsauchen]
MKPWPAVCPSNCSVRPLAPSPAQLAAWLQSQHTELSTFTHCNLAPSGRGAAPLIQHPASKHAYVAHHQRTEVTRVLGCHSCCRIDMFSKGTKRKFSDDGDEILDESLAGAQVSSSYSLQRQSLLDMSLIKLQLCHMLVEPNLCRSVLIANTVRQIQEEMTHDGTWQVVTETFCGGSQSPSERLVATEVLCRSREQDAEPKLFSVLSYEGCREEEVVTDETLCSVSVSDTASDVCLSESARHCWERDELVEVERDEEACESSRLGPGDDDDDDDNDDDEVDEEEESSRVDPKTMGQVFGTFEIKNSAPGPDSALEELFSDVDASYYDLDTMLTGIQSAPKMGPYDLLDSLAPSHGPPSIGSPSNCRSDLNELDHIMEIIVGS